MHFIPYKYEQMFVFYGKNWQYGLAILRIDGIISRVPATESFFWEDKLVFEKK